MGNYVGLGSCKKCGKDKIDVDGEIRCLSCEATPNPPSGLVVKVDDPGEERMRQVLASSGVAIPKAVRSERVVETIREVSKLPLTIEEQVNKVIQILNTLPMPKDIKQFKAINKAVKAVEKILGE
jgi:uncharacterized Zn finger protein (UPF0148 family)